MNRGPQFSFFGDSGTRPAEGAERAEEPRADGAEPAEEELRADGSSIERALSVRALNASARRLLERSFPSLWVVGEIANWRRAASGHRYFTLRDADAQLSCAMFQGDARRLPIEPEDGTEVFVFGRVSLYEPRGRYEFIARGLEPKGEGLWRLAFEKLRRKLEAEGLLDPVRKRRLPGIPSTVGVVTSRSGAALRDVVTVIHRRAPWTRILVRDCRVQGEGAALDIREALEALGRLPEVELIILTRGGGSVEDLWAFNEEAVARSVAACPVPVISAVGHEIDVTIADLVADLRAPTPSAAAELAVPDAEQLVARVRRLSDSLVTALRRHIDRGRERAERAEERLLRSIDRRFERWEERVARLGDRLEALSPLRTLRRGYSVALSEKGEVLRRVEMFREGERFHLRVLDGSVKCETRELRPGEPGS